MSRRPLSLLLPVMTVTALGPVAQAQGTEYETEAEAETVFLISPGRTDAGNVETETVLLAVNLGLKGEALFENGVAIGVVLEGAAQLDHPARPGFSGQIGDGTLTGPSTLRGAFTGLTTGGVPEDTGARAQVERGYVYAEFGFGEVRGGIDRGVAARFFRGAPDVFEYSKADAPRLDSSGVATVITESNLTGPSPKLTYTTPRILGLRAGLSYTPEASRRGLDRDPARQIAGVVPFELDDTVEFAANISRRLPKSGVRVRAAVSYARASIDQTEFQAERVNFGAEFDRPDSADVVTVGGSLEFEQVEFGGSWLTSSNGGGRYDAWSVGAGGAVKDFAGQNWADFDWSVNYGQSRDQLTGLDGDSWSAGVSFEPIEAIKFSFGAQGNGLESGLGRQTSIGPVIEMALRF